MDNISYPKYLHNYMSRGLDGENKNRTIMHNIFYYKLEDIPIPVGPEDPQMYNTMIYGLTPVPEDELREVKRKQREDEEYKKYLELKAKYES